MPTTDKCPLCRDGEVRRVSGRNNINVATCHCGEWEFSDQDVLLERVGERPDAWLLSAWIRNRFEATGQPYRYSDRANGELPTDLVEPSVLAKIDAALLWIADSSEALGRYAIEDRLDLVARWWTRDEGEFEHIVQHLVSEGFAIDGSGKVRLQSGEVGLSLTARGWGRAQELRPLGRRGRTVFVAMNFSDDFDSARTKGIEPAIVDCGYEPYSVKGKHFGEKIDDHILAQLRLAAIAVVECTGQRQNVYFEAGFAMGLGIPVIWCCQADDAALHFDVRQYPCIMWRDPADLREKLRERIQARFPLDAARLRR